MNKIETLKQEADGLDVGPMIAAYAKAGWERISDGDIHRLKWYGLFLRNPTPGHFMIRVRMPGGRTGSYQLRTLAQIAQEFGNGLVDVTTRQQVQLRHIRIEHVPEIFARMEAVGLTSLQTGMDNVRNVMTCPVAGLSPDELFDPTPLVLALTHELAGNRAYSNLPRKCNVVISACPYNCLHCETQDLAFVPAALGAANARRSGYNVLIGGKLGSGGYRIATPLDLFVEPCEVQEVALAVLEIFRDCGSRESRNTNRLAFLIEDWGESRFRAALESRVGRSLTRAGVDGRRGEVRDHIGIYRQRQPGMNYVGLKIPVGRMRAEDLMAVAGLAERYGVGEIRLSAAQALIIPHVPDRRVGDLTEEPVVGRFGYNPSPVHRGLVSCVGNDYCNLAVIETKRRALELASALEARFGERLKPITMHWSGCPAGCGNHLVADIGLLGKKTKVDGRIVEAVDVFIGGRTGPEAHPAVKLLEDVPCERLSEALAGLVQFHAREKMHRSRGEGKAFRKRPEREDDATPTTRSGLSGAEASGGHAPAPRRSVG